LKTGWHFRIPYGDVEWINGAPVTGTGEDAFLTAYWERGNLHIAPAGLLHTRTGTTIEVLWKDAQDLELALGLPHE